MCETPLRARTGGAFSLNPPPFGHAVHTSNEEGTTVLVRTSKKTRNFPGTRGGGRSPWISRRAVARRQQSRDRMNLPRPLRSFGILTEFRLLPNRSEIVGKLFIPMFPWGAAVSSFAGEKK